ncbi:30S ribosomal protein S12 methylthiotransferase RimO [Sulfurospirillum sp. T05]|uniref:Ribosomal protein uS12 methylthiotransferase RimO n=1 Tax=Sulfurospirillum tamanense TaxID=2813362 RepID=A0ABS2WSU8_9BACT|nr:30S ribosomal protein S12 methylthiotransferase RimO [Sulfurospirillum tamanensis]MBN2964678.1 30S ribosomal protein S12 methylthiotransferase RimO [Sulfurospirillum tamanensis]
MQKTLHLVSLGCNKNLVDSEIMLGKLKAYTLTNDPSTADVLIVNTCGFIGPAKEESLNTIFELHEARKEGSLLVVAGCLTQRYREDLMRELPEVDLFTGVGDYGSINEIIAKKESRFSPRVYLQDTYDRVITGSNAHAYIKLSEGCNQQCSFCAIPGFKGKLNSRSLEDIVAEVTHLVAQGFYDFSFLSQDSSSYLRDHDINDGLIGLIDAVEAIEGIKSARILYLYPSTTSDALIDRIGASALFHNYFDMPIQHISDPMLKRMRRGAGKARILEQLLAMRALPNSFVRTSIIAGHPGESEAEFEEVRLLLESFPFDRVTVFAYSDEEETLAYGMEEKIDTKTLNKRLKTLEKLVSKTVEACLEARIGTQTKVLIEGESSEHKLFMGARDLTWAPEIDGEVLINDSDIGALEVGKTYHATITQRAGDKLLATVTAPA